MDERCRHLLQQVSHFRVRDRDAQFPCGLQLQTLVDQLVPGVLPQFGEQTGAGALDGLLLQGRSDLLLALLKDGEQFLPRLAGIGSDHVLLQLLHRRVRALGLDEALEGFLRLIADIRAEALEARALVDIARRDGLVVHYHHDPVPVLRYGRRTGIARSRLGGPLGRRLRSRAPFAAGRSAQAEDEHREHGQV
jgi:hypothetical protein